MVTWIKNLSGYVHFFFLIKISQSFSEFLVYHFIMASTS